MTIMHTKLEGFPVSEFWKTRNEQTNFNQRHDVEMLKEEQRKVVESEIRKQVMLPEMTAVLL